MRRDCGFDRAGITKDAEPGDGLCSCQEFPHRTRGTHAAKNRREQTIRTALIGHCVARTLRIRSPPKT